MTLDELIDAKIKLKELEMLLINSSNKKITLQVINGNLCSGNHVISHTGVDIDSLLWILREQLKGEYVDSIRTTL